jgi:hypothetical protein
LQLLFIVLGFLALAIVLKFNGYPNETFIRWTPLARGLREHGLWLLIVPVVWAVFTVVAVQIERGVFSSGVAGPLGVILAFAILILFLYATFNSYTRPLLFHRPPASATSGTN